MQKMLLGKVALVTGASRGIGRGIALTLARAGALVAVNYHRPESEEAAMNVCRQIDELGGRAKAYRADVRDAGRVRDMMDRVANDLGPIGILVNNAGITRDKTFVKMLDEMWREVIETKLTGAFNVTQAVLPHMLNACWGRIVMITAEEARYGGFGRSNFAAAAAGLEAAAKSWAAELARRRILVNCVSPGLIKTDMVKDYPKVFIDGIISMTPCGRLGDPEDVAQAVLFLVSPNNKHITGQVIPVNGGMHTCVGPGE